MLPRAGGTFQQGAVGGLDGVVVAGEVEEGEAGAVFANPQAGYTKALIAAAFTLDSVAAAESR